LGSVQHVPALAQELDRAHPNPSGIVVDEVAKAPHPYIGLSESLRRTFRRNLNSRPVLENTDDLNSFGAGVAAECTFEAILPFCIESSDREVFGSMSTYRNGGGGRIADAFRIFIRVPRFSAIPPEIPFKSELPCVTY
jgi:hypothetical protein